jgi:hypothetical protein
VSLPSDHHLLFPADRDCASPVRSRPPPGNKTQLTQQTVFRSSQYISPAAKADLTSSASKSSSSIRPIVQQPRQSIDAVEGAMETKQPSTQQPSLPAELLRDIVSLCEPASLLNLCLANTVFRAIVSPILYKSLSFSSPTQAEAFLRTVRPFLALCPLTLTLFLLRIHIRTIPEEIVLVTHLPTSFLIPRTD